MAYDSIKAAREQGYTREELKTWLTGSLKDLDAFKKEHPAEFQQRRAIAERLGIVGPSAYGTPAPNTPYKRPTRTYTPSELALHGQYSEAAIRAYFNSKESSDEFHSDRNEYERKREAGVSYGLFEKRATPYIPTKPAEPEWTMTISNELGDESNLPRGTVVNSEQLSQLCQQKVDRARQAQEAADAKLAADRATELATLTARQQADQADRDRKQRDL